MRGLHGRLERCTTFAGGLATRYPGSAIFLDIMSSADGMTLVDDEALIDAAVVTLAEPGLLPEGAGAAGVAALLAQPERYTCQKVVLLMSGGNFEPAIWNAVQTGRQDGPSS